MIQYVSHNDIDKEKWDHCIQNSSNGLIYSFSWYLDIVSLGWDAMIENDYESILPLTWRRKMGIYYLYKPFFTQQLGISGKNISPEKTTQFLRSIPGKYKFIDIALNETNEYSGSDYIVQNNDNHILDLNKSYADIRNHSYNRNCRRNIDKANKVEMLISERIDPKDFIAFIRENLEKEVREVKKRDYNTLLLLIHTLLKKKYAEIYGAILPSGEMCAAALYLIYNKRCIFFICASTDKGKQFQSMHFLVDDQIKRYAGKLEKFDFSGSNRKGIAYFNSTFGAISEPYISIKKNKLPGILKRIKN